MFGKKYIIFAIAAIGLLFLQSCENDWTDFDIPGCMDNNASNYDFNANIFKEVLTANRECESATLEVSSEGLSKITFNVDDFSVTYWLVASTDVD